MTFEIGMLLFPDLTQLDLTGPQEVLANMPGARVTIVAKTLDPIRSESNLVIVPAATFDATHFDLVFVPGGVGQIAATDDAATLDWLRTCARRAKWMTSACTGALLLGAAGLLEGYRAATHWAFMDLLPLVGAIPTHERVVIDRDRITGGGVTAGIDIALAIVATIAGQPAADRIALQLEYPYRAVDPAMRDDLRARMAPRYAQREAQLRRVRPR